ncbi:MAG TPA: PIG-L family deacetylase [Bryobacteraceae bacterium]|jgi:LmbE family N-acetylglucosaminyl deacetylase
MNRRTFVEQTLSGAMLGPGLTAAPRPVAFSPEPELVIERPVEGKPHAGKVLAAIQPHSDDIPIFAAGTVAKLLKEGFTGYLIRVTNDDMAGPGTIGETVLANERDTANVSRVFGFQKVFNLNYNNHRVNGISSAELTGRFIFLFRLLKVDTVVCYDPWGHYEENPDHYITAKCVEAACWMANGSKDYPEHFEAGLKSHWVSEKYYFARFQQQVNRIVDVGPTIETKIDALLMNRAQGPAGEAGARLRASLASRGLRLPILGDNDTTANREYIRAFLLKENADLGRKYGLQYAEQFRYISAPPDVVSEYVKQHAISL